MIDWNIFKRRRDLDVKVWMQNLDISSYDQLCKVLKSLGVAPPTEAEISHFLPQVKVTVIAAITKIDDIIDPEIEIPAGPLAVPGLTVAADDKKRKTKKSKKDI